MGRIGKQGGLRTRRSGAAPTSTWAARRRRRRRHRLPSRTIARLGTQIGKLAGPRTRRSGAARTSRWDARKPPPSRMTATQVIPIGKPDGAMRRRGGVAPTSRRVARSELVYPELETLLEAYPNASVRRQRYCEAGAWRYHNIFGSCQHRILPPHPVALGTLK